MVAEQSIPFINKTTYANLGSLYQDSVNDERNSVDQLDGIDIEKIYLKENDAFTAGQEDSPRPRGRVKRSLNRVVAIASSGTFRVVVAALGSLGLAILGVVLFGVFWRHQTIEIVVVPDGIQRTSSGLVLSCGETFEDAKAAGCIFDVMTFAWTPPACLDEQVHRDVISAESELAETHGAGIYPWWRDYNRTEPLEQLPEVLSDTERPWTDNHYHRAHCLYLWRIMHRATTRVINGEKEVYVYSKAAEWEHVIHCNKLLNMVDKPPSDLSRAKRVVGHCVRVDGVYL